MKLEPIALLNAAWCAVLWATMDVASVISTVLDDLAIVARQLAEELAGKQVESAVRGNSPHKFAFYTCSPEEYASIARGKVVGPSVPHGSELLVPLEPDYVLELGGGGERILFHRSAATLPKKHHLLLHFTDDTYLTVTVMGWGSVKLLHRGGPARQARHHQWCSAVGRARGLSLAPMRDADTRLQHALDL